MNEQRQVFSLRQVVSSVRKTIEERYQSLYWVKAEMHKMNLYPSGHAFPELVQKEDGKIVAQINGSIWKHNLQKINQQFIAVLNEPMKEGATMLMQVKVVYSELYGISLQILDIDPSYTLGELQRERQETLLRLQKEGLLNKNQLLAFPLLPKRIAIISADTSKGLSDFMKVLNQNQFGYTFYTHLFFAYLQGDQAIHSIPKQLALIEQVKEHFDIVVIVRGGGGEVGLSCYNNYELCKAIANCSLPVLTGIGHSTNLTVAEMIAFRNAITPTELADYLLQAFHDFSVPVQQAVEQIQRLSNLILERSNVQFSQVVKNLKNSVQNNLLTHQNTWQLLSRKINSKSELLLSRQGNELHYLQKNLGNLTKRFIGEKQLYLQDAEHFLKQNSGKLIQRKSDELNLILREISLLDPAMILKRGYSIARVGGKTISKTNLPQQGQKIELLTFDHQITAITDEVKSQEKED